MEQRINYQSTDCSDLKLFIVLEQTSLNCFEHRIRRRDSENLRELLRELFRELLRESLREPQTASGSLRELQQTTFRSYFWAHASTFTKFHTSRWVRKNGQSQNCHSESRKKVSKVLRPQIALNLLWLDISLHQCFVKFTTTVSGCTKCAPWNSNRISEDDVEKLIQSFLKFSSTFFLKPVFSSEMK